MSEYKVCAIVVTYNRKDLLIRNLHSLLKQCYKLDILIVDNASTDGTYSYLQENEILKNSNVIYEKLDKNIGGAGGFDYGLRYAHSHGYDMYWLMDDDGYALNKDTLAILVNAMDYVIHKKDSLVIGNSVVILEDRETLTFGLSGEYRRSEILSKCKNNHHLYGGAINPFNGTMITKQVVDKIGSVRAEFFIGGDEVEYIERLKSKGGIIFTSLDSLYFHPYPPSGKVQKFGKLRTVSNDPLWKHYYRTRNMVYVLRMYKNKRIGFSYFAKKYIHTIMFEDNKKEMLEVLGRAYRDAVNGDFTNQREHLKPKK